VLSIGSRQYQAPATDEVEVSIFGPGYGECVVAHMGHNDWLVIDSCLEDKAKRSVALEYLETLGVDLSSAVHLVIATHWHDDHIVGLSDVCRATASAKFVCSAAMTSEQFESILATWRLRSFLPGGSGIDEMDAIVQVLKNGGAVRASAQKVLWSRNRPTHAEVRALSPSEAADLAMILRFGEAAAQASATTLSRRVPNIVDNHASVVISLVVGDARILLGSDLLVRTDRNFGWFAIIDSFSGTNHYQAYKIAHHGSSNADHDDIWRELLQPEPVAALTPFVRGGKHLPTDDDCDRIRRRTSEAYLTSPPRTQRFRDRNPRAERLMRRFTRQLHSVPSRFGHVRLRKKISSGNSNWNVSTFGAAAKL
jgi:beta-lactamase superfamily II metal-dependent hydrolase